MTSSPNDMPPRLFDRALLRDRQTRAVRLGPASFLLDRVAEDMAERQQAVLREFSDGIDLGTSGDQVHNVLRGSVRQLRAVALPVPTPSRWRLHRPRSILWSPRWRCSSSMTCRVCWRKSAGR